MNAWTHSFRRLRLVLLVGSLLGSVGPVDAQWNRALGPAEALIRKEAEKAAADLLRKATPAEGRKAAFPVPAELQKILPIPATTPPAGGPAVVFSKAPILPEQPAGLVQTFGAGDSIYALVRVDKTWRALLRDGDEEATEVQIPLDLVVDGQMADFQYITLKAKPLLDRSYLLVDIAPDPEKMTAYRDPDVVHGEGKGNRKIGPDQYTYLLGRLSPGRHVVKLQVRSYGDVLSAGEFTIDGADYASYAALRELVLKAQLEVGGMPEAQKTDVQLEAQMMKLLANAGWKNIRRLVIVDKDWWNDLLEGGDSPVVGRHIAAAVAAKKDDGTFFWSNVTFQQHKQIDGSFGPLEISHTGIQRPILEEKINP